MYLKCPCQQAGTHTIRTSEQVHKNEKPQFFKAKIPQGLSPLYL
jgi:hypothetical protein